MDPGQREAPGSVGGPEQGSVGRLCRPPHLQELGGTKVTFAIPWPRGRMVRSGLSWGFGPAVPPSSRGGRGNGGLGLTSQQPEVLRET